MGMKMLFYTMLVFATNVFVIVKLKFLYLKSPSLLIPSCKLYSLEIGLE